MKTAREKAEEFLLEMAVGNWEWDEMVDKLSIELKKQDRDTRHACTDSVNGMMADNVFTDSLARDEVFSAIMNTKAV